ncbi:MAG TPA: type II CAAX endopeptidase family protein [Gemmatimonadaceae bacterium]
MNQPKLFLTPGGGLRAPWRILIFLAVTFVASQVIAVLISPILVELSAASGAPGTVNSLVGVLALLCGHVASLRFVDGRPWSSVFLGRDASRPTAWIEGWILGALAIGIPCMVLVALGALRFVPGPVGSWLGAAARVSWFLLPAALLEELLARGYLFTVLREAAGWPLALGVTSVGFGLLHIPNYGSTVETITLVTLAGVFLGAVILATRSLYAGWMAHFAWNWMMAVPLHSPVSGFPLATPDYRLVDAGPVWLTGGAWGPEGGIAAAAGMIVALTYLYVRRGSRGES